MLWLTLILALAGLLLLLVAPPLARRLGARRRGHDPGALAHLLRLGGMILILAAALARPYNPETAAFPPSPDAPARPAAR